MPSTTFDADLVDASPTARALRALELIQGQPGITADRLGDPTARRDERGEKDPAEISARLLFRLVQAHYHGMLDEIPGHEQALDYLGDLPWTAFLTDPEVLRVYAAQVANQVHYLHLLGVMDLRREYRIMPLQQKEAPPDRLAT